MLCPMTRCYIFIMVIAVMIVSTTIVIRLISPR